MLHVFLILCYNIKRYDNVIPVIGLIWVIGGNALLIYFLIKRAVNKYVKPRLQSSGLIFVRSQWAGFFNLGDFGTSVFSLKPYFIRGNPSIAIYAYVYYKEFEVIKRFTIRIDTLFLFIRNVTFSSEI